METIKKIYRVKRDMQTESEVNFIESDDKIEDIPVEKVISAILHKIITQKEDDTQKHESEK